MNTNRKRQPVELLARIRLHMIQDWEHGAAPMPYRDATRAAIAEVGRLLKALPSYPVRRYYGGPGPLRNPFCA